MMRTRVWSRFRLSMSAVAAPENAPPMITTSYSKVTQPTKWTLELVNAISSGRRRCAMASNFSGTFRRLDGVSPHQNMIFTNARLIFPDGMRDDLELVVEAGKITGVREQTGAHGKDVVDLGGKYLAPGFVDLHVHGALGRDSMEASAEAFRAICDFHATGGTTSLLLTTATAPIETLDGVLNAVRDSTHRGGRGSHPTSAIAGVHAEGPLISKAKRGAQREEFIQKPSPAYVQQLLAHADVIKRV